MSEIELKPCPFCGGTKLKTGGDDKVVGVWCLTCQAAGPNHYGSREWNDRADFDARIRSAIERKPEPVDSRELIERLVKALKPFAQAASVLRTVERTTGREFKDEDAFQSGLAWNNDGIVTTITYGHLRAARAALSASPSPVDSRDGLIERLVKAIDAAETYVIDGVTTAKQNLEMNAAYPARKTRYEAELQEARDIYAECQSARRLALAAKEQQP